MISHIAILPVIWPLLIGALLLLLQKQGLQTVRAMSVVSVTILVADRKSTRLNSSHRL